MESQDYEYPVEAWLQDMEMELGNAGEYEKRLEFCNKVLEMFDWTYVAEDGFRCAVGEELYEAGKKKRKFIQTIHVRVEVVKNTKNAAAESKKGQAVKYEVTDRTPWGSGLYHRFPDRKRLERS